MEQKDENNRGGELKLKLKGGKKSLFIFIQKAFKHNNSFVDVGGILWTVFFFISICCFSRGWELPWMLHPCSSQKMGSSGTGSNAWEKLSQISDQAGVKRLKREKLL